jgi:two-component system, sensor histidine kinase and response regulator
VVDRDNIEHEDEKQDDEYPETKPMDILLAEDNKINQQVIVGLLHKFAHNVTVVSNGQEAVDMLRQRTFDLILMDMQMPVMDGLQATREIKAMGGAGARIPIIAITANALKGDNERCFAAGMVDHVSKPINPAGLFRVIARHAPEHAVLEDTAEQDTSHAKQAIAPVEGTAAIDLACLGELEKVMGEQYVRGFINDSMPGLVLYVNQLLKAQGNIQSMLHPAHEVKNLAAMFGLNGVAILTEGIERCCLEGRAQEADELLDRVPPSFNAGIEALRKVYPMERVSL